MSPYEKTEKFVTDTFTKSGKPTDVFHAQRTAYWVKELKPDADEAMLVAAVTHDIERAFHGDWKKGSDDPEILRKHQDLSAKEIEKFLRAENVDEKFIEKVKSLVSHHEVGGDEDQNMLCDADTLAYFEEKAMRYVKNYIAFGRPREIMKKKLENKFDRLHSEKAKQIARKWYDEAIKELEK